MGGVRPAGSPATGHYDGAVSQRAAGEPAPVQDARPLAAAGRVLADAGWQGLTAEAVAEAAGLSRVTAWRLGASRTALVATLLRQLGEHYREAMWPALVAPGDARHRWAAERARQGLHALIAPGLGAGPAGPPGPAAT
jgi:AcrR family transcriptional regulator